VSTIPD